MPQLSRAARRRPSPAARALCAGAALLAVAAPNAASAATFHVVPGGTGSCTPAHACGSIQDAVIAARSTPEHDLVDVAAGTYTQRITLDDATDQGIVVQGAGSDSNPAASTIVTAPDAGDPPLLAATTADDAAMTIRGMRLRPAAGAATAASINGGVTLEDDTLEGGASSPALYAEDGAVTLRRVTATGAGGALDASGAQATITDSRFTTTSSTIFAVVVGGGTIMRSTFTGGPGGSGLDVIGNTTVDSSLVTGGSLGIRVENTDAEQTLLQNVTVDVGLPGTADGGSIVGVAHQGGGELRIDSSIVREQVSFTGTGTLECAYDDVGTPATNDINCRTSAGENTTTAADQLFLDAAHGDWRLRADSPARDRGREGGLAAEESTLDLAGAPRIAKDDCYDVVRRDQGAYELPVVCPPRADQNGDGSGTGSGGDGAGSGAGSGTGGGSGTGTSQSPNGGGGQNPPPVKVVPNEAPVLRALKLRRSGKRLQAQAQVSEAAAVHFTLQRRVGKRWKTLKRVATTVGRAGSVSLRLRLRGLPKGKLRLAAQATDTQGATSRPVSSRTLTIR